MTAQIQIKRDTAANWSAANPVLAAGEMGWVTDSGTLKVGDGVTAWNALGSFVTGALKDYAEVTRTAGDLTLNATAVTAVHTSLDLTIAAASGDLVSYGASGLISAVASAPTAFDVYTMPSGSSVNPFGAGLSASLASTQGIQAWGTGTISQVCHLNGEVTRVLTSGDVAGGVTTLRLFYAKTNTTSRTLVAQTNTPLKVWAKNHGQV